MGGPILGCIHSPAGDGPGRAVFRRGVLPPKATLKALVRLASDRKLSPWQTGRMRARTPLHGRRERWFPIAERTPGHGTISPCCSVFATASLPQRLAPGSVAAKPKTDATAPEGICLLVDG